MHPLMQHDNVTIFFGNAKECPIAFHDQNFSDYCRSFVSKYNLASLTISKQVHGVDGMLVENVDEHLKLSLFAQQGDYLITQQPGIALAVLTADCLPVVIYDKEHGAVGVAHAGWRGSVAGVTGAMVRHMMRDFNSNPATLQVWFGAAARACCYEVKQDFIKQLSHLPYQEKVLVGRQGKLFFDGVCCNRLQLEQLGIVSKNIHTGVCVCTICTGGYHSYRRDKHTTLRQLTVVWVK